MKLLCVCLFESHTSQVKVKHVYNIWTGSHVKTMHTINLYNRLGSAWLAGWLADLAGIHEMRMSG